MEDRPVRKTERLRRGRVSLAGATYFVTACAKDRIPVFRDDARRERVLSVMRTLSSSGDWRVLAATVMSDHVHVLFTLGDRLSLDRVMSKFKAKARGGDAAWSWQANVYERRLRAEENAEDYAFYIFMNPYRAAGLAGTGARWPGWHKDEVVRWRFEEALTLGATPPPEWLGRVNEVESRIHAGE